jgi:hypothetical protein
MSGHWASFYSEYLLVVFLFQVAEILLLTHFTIGKDQKMLYQRIKKGFFTVPKSVDTEIKILLCDILRVNPFERLTAAEVSIFHYHLYKYIR